LGDRAERPVGDHLVEGEEVMSRRRLYDHEHGAQAVWATQCVHPACTDARFRYFKAWRVDRERGVQRVVSTDAARLHVFAMMGAGWSRRAIAGQAGVSLQTVCGLVNDEHQRIRKGDAEALLALDPTTLPTTTFEGERFRPFVPRVGSVRRVQALLAIGWRAADIAAESGLPVQTIYGVCHQKGQWVTSDTHEKVKAAYHVLSQRRGPSERTARRAANRGYPGPLAWQDPDHDEAPDWEGSAS
jgi:hypothetical protein